MTCFYRNIHVFFYKIKQDFRFYYFFLLTPSYTTDWSQLPKVK